MFLTNSLIVFRFTLLPSNLISPTFLVRGATAIPSNFASGFNISTVNPSGLFFITSIKFLAVL